ncbi:nucleoside 2-deoxyribosyltransferase [Cohnella thailandensis]|uniref:Nucleoside 2-deoxyribosyltransferase n=1 Tax=Cohnella thailandensis TaxID=557557 RepID=A0A841T444_9BACL|nr:nucleoside 2-deoxyribosyltransferase [Cohnella thailandensis]MBB6637769.1 nucleoside 2-deoxyribosyltransferase [Cohnella thailandensis]MBP1974054.1 nucleoside 2-deoxyribosyltransferase [Cohnella thailandensis]
MNEKTATNPRIKIYMAGFEVFRTDAAETGIRMKRLCDDYGFEGIFPLDKDIKPQPSKQETAKAIFEGNVRLVNKADVVIANLNPFRGAEPDSGTVFECGLAYGLGKKLYGFVSDRRTMAERLGPDTDPATGLYKDGMTVEDFGHPLNLMLSVPMTIVEGALEDALKRLSLDLRSSS